ncbi:MAG: PaaX family transcriptional regulator C-terminal domain-containing protein, partial [Rhodoblastus sp.]
DSLRKELLWEGYGAIAPGILAHPSTRTEDLMDILQTAGAHDKVVAMQARTLGALSSRPLKEIVDQCWRLGEIAGAYRNFVETFRPVARALRGGANVDPQLCFIVRTLLIHEFRRVQLRDPLLPRQLLPAGWPGDTARALCREIYAACWTASEAHLMAGLETADGPLRPVGQSIQSRFAGLALRQQMQEDQRSTA